MFIDVLREEFSSKKLRGFYVRYCDGWGAHVLGFGEDGISQVSI